METILPKLKGRTIKHQTVRDTISNLDSLLGALSDTKQKELLDRIKKLEDEAKGKGLIKDDETPKVFKQGQYEDFLAGSLPPLYKEFEKIYMDSVR